jgi:hypothetical protein
MKKFTRRGSALSGFALVASLALSAAVGCGEAGEEEMFFGTATPEVGRSTRASALEPQLIFHCVASNNHGGYAEAEDTRLASAKSDALRDCELSSGAPCRVSCVGRRG